MMEKLSFLGCKYFQLVHHVWRHIPSFTRQLRWIVLWTDTYASSFWQPLLNGYVADMLNSHLFHVNNIFLNCAFSFQHWGTQQMMESLRTMLWDWQTA